MFCNTPRTALVVVRALDFLTPRIDIHKCSQSIITITPSGFKISTIASAICVVRRSCTCGLREYISTKRAILESPVIFPLGIYPTCATPWKGVRWCSQCEKTSISRTITSSSWPISKVVVKTSSGDCHRPSKFSFIALATRAGVSFRPSRSGSSPKARSSSRTAFSARAWS